MVTLDPAISMMVMLGFVALFASAAYHKLREPRVFSAALADYRLLPDSVAPIAAVILAIAELGIGLALLWNQTRASAAVTGAALLAVYAAAIGVNLFRGRHELDCGCGLEGRPINAWMVVRNLVLSAVLLTLCLPVAARALSLGDFATIAAGFGVTALLYISADLLLSRPALREPFSPEQA